MEVLFEHSENSKILDHGNSFFDHVDILGEQLWSLGGSECTIILAKKKSRGDNAITRILIQWITVNVVLL